MTTIFGKKSVFYFRIRSLLLPVAVFISRKKKAEIFETKIMQSNIENHTDFFEVCHLGAGGGGGHLNVEI